MELRVVRRAWRPCQNARSVVIPIRRDVQSDGPAANQEGTDHERDKEQLPAGVGVNRRRVEDRAVKVDIARAVARRVDAGPTPQGWRVVAMPEVVQAAGVVELVTGQH